MMAEIMQLWRHEIMQYVTLRDGIRSFRCHNYRRIQRFLFKCVA